MFNIQPHTRHLLVDVNFSNKQKDRKPICLSHDVHTSSFCIEILSADWEAMNPDLKNGLMGLLRNCAAVGFVAIVILFRRVYPDGFQLYKIGNMIAEGLDHKYVVDAISFNEYMESAIIIIRSGFPPISFLDLCGSILSCFSYRKNLTSRKSWFESLLSCTLMQFGGTTLTGILLGQTPSWIVSHSAFPALMVAWWFTFFSPYDIFYNTLLRAPFSLFFVGIFSSISGGHAVTSWGVDKALNNTFHVNHVRISQSVLTCIACGTLSASGGGLLCNIFRQEGS